MFIMVPRRMLSGPVLLVIATCLLVACSDIKGAIDFSEDRDDFRDRRDLLQSKSNTAYLGVPDTGTATYSGEASLGVGDRDLGVVLIGAASITVDFANGDVTGQLGDFGGFDTDEDYSKYVGTLVLEGGMLGSVNPNDVDAQITGTLSGENYVIGVDALWEGHLKGTPIIGVLGDTTGLESTFTLNGDTAAGGIIIAVTD